MTRNKYRNKKNTIDEKPIRKGNSAVEIIARTTPHDYGEEDRAAMVDAIHKAIRPTRVWFTVLGEPQGKARPRFTRSGHTYTPDKTVAYENAIRAAFIQQCGLRAKFPETAVLKVSLTALFALPQSISGAEGKRRMAKVYCPKKPDADNVLKAVCDALNGFAYNDDKQIVAVSAEKYYTAGEPRVEIEIGEV